MHFQIIRQRSGAEERLVLLMEMEASDWRMVMRKNQRISLDWNTISNGVPPNNLEEIVIVARREGEQRTSKEEMAKRLRNQREKVKGDGITSEGAKDAGGIGGGEAKEGDSPPNVGEESGPTSVDQSEDGEGADSSRRSSDEGGE
jgi:hypothetical protein